MMSTADKKAQRWHHAVAGVGAGAASTLAFHPLDIMKVRMQAFRIMTEYTHTSSATKAATVPALDPKTSLSSSGTITMNNRKLRNPRVLQTLISSIRQEGLRVLYRGLSANLVGNVTAWGLFFLGYETLKPWMAAYSSTSDSWTGRRAWPSSSGNNRGGSLNDRVTISSRIAAGFVVSAGVLTLTNPIWVVKTRMFVSTPDQLKPYRNVFTGMKSLYLGEGIRGLYSGYVPGLLGVLHGAVQICVYEELKGLFATLKNVTRVKIGMGVVTEGDSLAVAGSGENATTNNVSVLECLVSASISKYTASCVTYPAQVMRTRMQSPNMPPLNFRAAVLEMWREGGVRAFYRGLTIHTLRVIPSACAVFLAYEAILRSLVDGVSMRVIS